VGTASCAAATESHILNGKGSRRGFGRIAVVAAEQCCFAVKRLSSLRQLSMNRERRNVDMSKEKNETAKGGPKKEVYTFFVSGKKYETDQPALTGLQIKARVADWDQSHDLVLEGHGTDPDRIIADDESVSLAKDKGPLRFSSAPKANFG
jgi:hypothetical protein